MLSIYSSEPPTNPRSNFAGEERLSGGAAPSARAGGGGPRGPRGGRCLASPLLERRARATRAGARGGRAEAAPHRRRGHAGQEAGPAEATREAGASPRAEGASGRPAGSGAEQEAGARAGATREGAKHALRPWIQRSGMGSWCSGTIFRFFDYPSYKCGMN